ncbi:MAG: WD repeat-containing protein jip5 [Thelocarpon impressellum]|nr:MAG: WD repeat-containing protein jip5 [Thelocarpon impressellum]
MLDTICTLPLTSSLECQAVHPTEPLVAVGLFTGHVETFRLPALAEEAGAEAVELQEGRGKVESVWRTRRHKDGCRTLGFSVDGETLYSAGPDGIVKAASTSTGQVTAKVAVPSRASDPAPDEASLVHELSPQTLLLATDASFLYVYDLRAPSTGSSAHTPSQRPAQTYRPHGSYHVSSLTPLPPSGSSTSGFSKQWVTTGGSTLAVTDVRKGVLVKSEDQDDDLLSSLFVGGLPHKSGRGKGEKILVGGSEGVLTLWERGVWADQDERIIVDTGRGGGETLDLLAMLPEGLGGQSGSKHVAVGLGDGKIKIARLGLNKVVAELGHGDIDDIGGVTGLGVDVSGRLISGGGATVKVWTERLVDDDDEEADAAADGVGVKRTSRDDSEEEDEEAESSEEEDRKRRKKRKRGRGRDRGGNVKPVLGFKGLD